MHAVHVKSLMMAHKPPPLIYILLCSTLPSLPLDNRGFPVGLFGKRILHSLEFCRVGKWVGRCKRFWLLSERCGYVTWSRVIVIGFVGILVVVVVVVRVVITIIIIIAITRVPVWPGNRQGNRSIFAKRPITTYAHFMNKKCTMKWQMITWTEVDCSTMIWLQLFRLRLINENEALGLQGSDM